MRYTAKLVVSGKVEHQGVEAETDLQAYQKATSVAASRFPNQSIMVLSVRQDPEPATMEGVEYFKILFGIK